MSNRESKIQVAILDVWMIAGPFFEPVEEANASLLWVAQRTGFPICGDTKECKVVILMTIITVRKV